jgi:hypothetical protein
VLASRRWRMLALSTQVEETIVDRQSVELSRIAAQVEELARIVHYRGSGRVDGRRQGRAG